MYSWRFWAREDQLAPPGDWRTCLKLAGRGWGKTRSGGEWVLEREASGAERIALVGRTFDDVRDVMVEGESGILVRSPPWHRPRWNRSQNLLVWPRRRDRGGALLPETRAQGFSAEVPDKLRGPQHDTAWADELAAWAYPEAWDHLQFGMRLGDPRVFVTTTPRPTKEIRELLADSTTRTARGSTFDNAANLPRAFLERMVRKYEGTRLGRQELYAEILEDAPGALWKRDALDALRRRKDGLPDFVDVVVAVDPATTSGEDADETGIVVAGVAEDGHGYVLEDLSGHYTPHEWAQKVVAAVDKHKADRVVAETNQGGDMVEANLHTARRGLFVRKVHASRGKRTRAEPVAALYEQGRVHHIGYFARLEEQMTQWEPGISERSPDRMDALVYALTELMVDRDPEPTRRTHATRTTDFDSEAIGL